MLLQEQLQQHEQQLQQLHQQHQQQVAEIKAMAVQRFKELQKQLGPQ
jgi:DNA anti-recombination protein RmuC